jgi:hypothetical protein
METSDTNAKSNLPLHQLINIWLGGEAQKSIGCFWQIIGLTGNAIQSLY